MENLQTLWLDGKYRSEGKYPQQVISLLNSDIFPRLRKLALRSYKSLAESAMLPSLIDAGWLKFEENRV